MPPRFFLSINFVNIVISKLKKNSTENLMIFKIAKILVFS